MKQIKVSLSMDQMEALAEGETFVIKQPDLHITIHADSDAVDIFRQHVQTSLLNLQPASQLKH